jgi:hypothetical protein
MTFLDYALASVRRGWYTFPCKPKNKFPAGWLVHHGHLDSTLDEAQIRAWWSVCPDANVGVDCGRSGLCVFDCDEGNADHEAFMYFMEAHNLPLTYAVRTGRRVRKPRPGSPATGLCRWGGRRKENPRTRPSRKPSRSITSPILNRGS